MPPTRSRTASAPAVGQINVPALYTCGEFDECTPATAKDFAVLTPNAWVEVILDALHTAHLEQHELYMATIKELFASLT